MPEGHAQLCERHIAACVVMTGLRGRCNGAKPCTEAAAATLCVVG